MKQSKICKALNCDEDLTGTHHFTTRCKECYTEYRKEYLRMYMSNRVAKDKTEKMRHMITEDILITSNQHMIGLGTFTLPKFNAEDPNKEFNYIRKLKRQTMGNS